MSSDGRPRYPWDKWFNQKVFELKQGRDFDCMPHSMIVQIRQVASSRGVRVLIKTRDNMLIVSVKKKGAA